MLHFILASFLFCAPAEDVDLLSVVPAEAQIVATIESVGELREAVGKNAIGQFLADPELKELTASFMKVVTEMDGYDEEIAALMPTRLWETVSGGIALYLEIEGKERGAVTALIEPGEERDAFDEYLIAFRDFVLGQEDVSDSLELYGGEELLVVTKEKEGDGTPGLVLCDTGTVVILCIHVDIDKGVESVQTIVDSLKGEATGESILDSALFTETREIEGGAGMVEIFADAGSLIDLAIKESMKEGDEENLAQKEKIIDLLGLEGITSAYMKWDVGENETMDTTGFLGIGPEGAIRTFAECIYGPIPRELLKLCPAEAVSVWGAFFDVNGLYEDILDFVKAIDEDAIAGYREMYTAMIMGQFGIDPEKEIIALLDGRFGSFSIEIPEDEFVDTGLSMGNQGGVTIVGLKDAEAFRKNLEKMLRVFGLYVSVKTEDFQGHTVYSIQLPGMPVRPHWVFGGDMMGISLFPTPIRSFVRLMAHEDQPNILSKEKFAAMVNGAGDSGIVMVMDTARSYNAGLDALEQIMSQASMTGLGEENPALAGILDLPLPSRETVDKYFKGVSSNCIYLDETGIHMRSSMR